MLMTGEYEFLSNFYPCNISISVDGKEYNFKSTEAAFQAHKNFSRMSEFENLEPGKAKRLGRKIDITTPNWDDERYYVMARLLHVKFLDEELLKKLKDVKEEIVEDNYWHDTTWGRCNGEGKNILGRLLTIIKNTDNNLNELYSFIAEELL